MPQLTYRDALNQAMDEEMSRDQDVLLMGEEVAQYNGAYKVSRGLLDKFGDRRVIDTPITEEGFTGIGIGAAMAGLRPIVEWMTFNFSIQALDQVINNAAKMLYMSGGQFNIPIVFRGANGPAEFLSSQHSQNLSAIYSHIPGLKVVAPATPYDAKGMLKTAIRDDNPVIFMEAELLYPTKGDVPEDEYLIPFGRADIKKPGSDVTIISFGKVVNLALSTAERLSEMNIDAEILDLRSLRPLDSEAVIESVTKTNRCVIVDESWPVSSFGAYISHVVTANCFDILDAEPNLVSLEDVPMPYNHTIELAAQPSEQKIIEAVKNVLYID